MRKTNHPRLWRQTPPAIFPVSLGFMGLGLAWRNAAGILPLPHEIGDLILGLSTAFLAYFIALYVAKLIRRPRVVWEDMKTPPGRAGVSALPMAVLLLVAALLPFNVEVPEVWWAGVVLEAAVVILSILTLWRNPPELRAFSPFQYLSFVGPVVAPLAGVPLGFVQASYVLTIFALIAWFIITLGYGRKFLIVRPPVPLRPSLAIALAAVSLLGIAFSLFENTTLFLFFYALSWGFGIALLLAGRWLMKDGWTPVWGAFTFPAATYTNLQIVAYHHGFGTLALVGTWLGLAIGTPLILYIVYKAIMSFIQGDLAKKSGAALA